MDPLAFLPTHSGGTSSSSSSDDSDTDATDCLKERSTRTAPPKTTDQKSKSNGSREAGAASRDSKKAASGVSVEQLAKYGYAAGEKSLVSGFLEREAEEAAAQRKKEKEAEEKRRREEEKLAAIPERKVIPENERRSKALKAQLSVELSYRSSLGHFVDASATYGDCLDGDQEAEAKARAALKKRRVQ